MKVAAKSRYLKISPQKLRQAAALARNQQAGEAMDVLRVTNKKAAGIVYETLKSAMANAENNHNLNSRNLTVDEIRVDTGPKLKRYRPRSRGMAHKIIHPMSHLTVILDDSSAAARGKSKPQTAAKTAAPAASVTKPKPAATNQPAKEAS